MMKFCEGKKMRITYIKQTITHFTCLAIDYLKKLNVYVTTNEDTPEERRKQIISTRLFIVLFIISLISLLGYASLSLQLITVTIQYPSQSIFEKLSSTYSDTLVCPCSQTSIQINKFLGVTVSYHEVCSSMFINEEWISSISYSIPQLFYALDTRRMLSSQLQLLASQCRLSKAVINDTLTILGSNQLFLPRMISRKDFLSQVDIIIDEAITNTKVEQNENRRFIQNINQQNQLATALGNNFMYNHNSNNRRAVCLVK